MKDPVERRKCWNSYRLKHAQLRLRNAQKFLTKCKPHDDICKNRNKKNIENAKNALQKAKEDIKKHG